MIEAQSLTKAYSDLVRGDVLALSDVSFSAAAGQVYGLLGPNGAGKTTALRILSTVLQPTSGTAIVGGFDCVTQPEMVRHQIGFISANTAVYDRMTAWEMVEYFGRLYGMERRRAARADGAAVRPVPDAGDSRPVGREDVDRHEAKGVDRPGDRARSAGADLRRSDDGARRARGAGAAWTWWRSCATRASASCSRRTSCARRSGCATAIAIMHRGHILAEGTLEELRDQHEERDLEELFFQLIKRQQMEAVSNESVRRTLASPWRGSELSSGESVRRRVFPHPLDSRPLQGESTHTD